MFFIRRSSICSSFTLAGLISCASPPPQKALDKKEAPLTKSSPEIKAAPGTSDDARAQVVLLYFSDTHGHLRPAKNGVGGYARLATLFKNEKEKAGSKTDVFIVAGGDIMGKGAGPCRATGEKLCVPLLKQMGVDVGILGNGELKRTAQELSELITLSKIPWVGTNVHSGGGNWVPSFLFNGPKSGAKFWLSSWTEAPTPGEIDLKKARLQIDRHPSTRDFENWKRRYGQVPVLWATHQEMPDDMNFLSMACQNSNLKTLALLKSNDHEHREDHTLCAPLFEPGAFGSYVSRVVIRKSPETGAWTVAEHAFISVGNEISEDAALKNQVSDLYKRYAPTADEIFAQVKAPLNDKGFAQWVADAFRHTTHADVAIANMGAVKSGIETGPLTREDLSFAYPYTDELMGLDWGTRDLERSLCTASRRTLDSYEDFGSELVLSGATLSGGGTANCHLEVTGKHATVKVVMVSFLARRSKRWLGKDVQSNAFKFGLNTERAFQLEVKKSEGNL